MNKEFYESGQSTENKILAAAEAEFVKKGYAAARTTSIAEAAGVTHAMLHYYFRTKEMIFEKIVESKMGYIRDLMLGSIDAPGRQLLEKIEMMIATHFDFVAAHPDLPRFFINEVCSTPERITKVVGILQPHARRVWESLQCQIDEAAESGLCRRVDARMLVLDIVSLNIFPFLAAPMINPILSGVFDDRELFIAQRKHENIETIMRKLRP